MSSTPRVDAEQFTHRIGDCDYHTVVSTDFARQLERDLARAETERDTAMRLNREVGLAMQALISAEVERERVECARVCERIALRSDRHHEGRHAARECETLIKARKKTPNAQIQTPPEGGRLE